MSVITPSSRAGGLMQNRHFPGFSRSVTLFDRPKTSHFWTGVYIIAATFMEDYSVTLLSCQFCGLINVEIIKARS
jgi:hypothetical protein